MGKLLALAFMLLCTAPGSSPSAAQALAPTKWETSDLSIYVGALAVDPTQDGRLYAAGAGARDTETTIYRSLDGGRTWATVAQPGVGIIVTLTVDPMGTVYIADRLSGLVRSSDTGETWNRLDFPPQRAKGVAVDPTDPAILYVVPGFPWSVWKSTDAGVTWAETALPEPCDLSIVVVYPLVSSTVYAAGGCGALRSLDAGASWELLSLPATSVTGLVATPGMGGRLYVGSSTGLWTSDDRGASWTPAANVFGVQHLAIDPGQAAAVAILAALHTDRGLEVIGRGDGEAWWQLRAPADVTEIRALVQAGGRAILGTETGIWTAELPVQSPDPRAVIHGSLLPGLGTPLSPDLAHPTQRVDHSSSV